jgi:hypothetical protein
LEFKSRLRNWKINHRILTFPNCPFTELLAQ